MKHPLDLIRPVIALAGALAALAAGNASAAPSHSLEFSLTPIGRFTNNAPFNLSSAEIVAHDPDGQRLFVGNARDRRVDVLDIRNPAHPVQVAMLDLSPYGAVVNSVAVHGKWIAVAVEATVKTSPGVVVLFNRNLAVVSVIPAGALPDMVTFTPNGRYLLCANEGEPNTYNNFGMESNGPSIDPEGSITIVDLSSGGAAPTVRTVSFTPFNGMAMPGIRIFGPNATVAQDLEPEYIAVARDSKTAWVTLQENNALAVVDIPSATVTALVPLGWKDHSRPGYGLDPSDQDGGIRIQPWPVRGLFQPDTIASYRYKGDTYLVTANEGETRSDWPGFRDDARLSTLALDTNVFPNAAELKRTNNLGRLTVSRLDGDIDQDGDQDAIYAYGGRSFTIWTADGQVAFDSGDELEQITAALFPLQFNASHGNNTLDNRSPAKGPEPEGLAIGKAYGRTLAFIGLERIGGLAVYDISDPFEPVLEDYVNTRTFNSPFNFATNGDLGPEGVTFISADNSPNGKPLVVVAHEVSGSTVIYQLDKKRIKKTGKPDKEDDEHDEDSDDSED